jgi:hypothetical protein
MPIARIESNQTAPIQKFLPRGFEAGQVSSFGNTPSDNIEGVERAKRVEFRSLRRYSDCKKEQLTNLQVQTFRTRQQAIERIKAIQATLIRPEKVYDPEDPNADGNGYVWVISMSSDGSDDKSYLCSDGFIR